MQLPSFVLTEYTSQDEHILRLWGKDDRVLRFAHALEGQLQDSQVGFLMPSGRRVARPTLRWIGRDRHSDAAVGYISVQITGKSGPGGQASPVGPPFYGGVNIVVDPQRHGMGIGPAMLTALFDQRLLADIAELGGTVAPENDHSLGMLRKLGITAKAAGNPGERHHCFTIPGPAAR